MLMNYIFHPSMNTIARASIIGGILLVAVLGGAIYYFVQAPFMTNVGVAVDQPVPFSHLHHVRQLGIGELQPIEPVLHRAEAVCARSRGIRGDLVLPHRCGQEVEPTVRRIFAAVLVTVDEHHEPAEHATDIAEQ